VTAPDLRTALLRAWIARLAPDALTDPRAALLTAPAPRIDTTGRPAPVYLR
jgi:hypothetical protein